MLAHRVDGLCGNCQRNTGVYTVDGLATPLPASVSRYNWLLTLLQ